MFVVVIIHDFLADIRVILENLGIGFRLIFIPVMSMRIAYPVDILPLIKYSQPL
jgi:hypothetical protein